MAIPAGYDQVRLLVCHELKELGRDRPPWRAPYLVCNDDPVAPEICRHVCQRFFRLPMRFVLADLDEQDLVSLL
jgi:hypothetical protein